MRGGRVFNGGLALALAAVWSVERLGGQEQGPGPSPREALLAEAERFCEKERWDEAALKFREALALAPGTEGEYARLAEVLLSSGKAERAVQCLREARALYPDEGDLGIQLGLCLHEAGRYSESYALLRELEASFRARSPGLLDDTFFFYLGSAAERVGRVQEAETHFRKAMDLALAGTTPDRAARPANSLGYLLLEQNVRLEEALELIRNANEWAPETAAYADSLGWAYFKLQRYREALVELLRAERLLGEERGRDPDLLDHIGQAYFRLGHRDQAMAYLRQAIAQAPEQPAYRERLEAIQKAVPVAPVSLEFLQDQGGAGDKKRGRRRSH